MPVARNAGTCDCPETCLPCEHILSIECDLDDDTFAELIREANPFPYHRGNENGFYPPQEAKKALLTRGNKPVIFNGKLYRPSVKVYAQREATGQAIMHPEDRFIEHAEVVGRLVHTNAVRNGSEVGGDLVELNAADGPGPDVIPFVIPKKQKRRDVPRRKTA